VEGLRRRPVDRVRAHAARRGGAGVAGGAGGRDVHAYDANDYRFTTNGETLYAFIMAWPEGGKATIKSPARQGGNYPREIGRVELLANPGTPLQFTRADTGLVVSLPEKRPNEIAYAMKITPA
jgi:alpha-L-fucosidase